MSKSPKKIGADEISLLTLCIKKHNPDLISLIYNIHNANITQDQRRALQSAIGAEMTSHGVGSDGEINDYGLMLDELISRLFDICPIE